MDFLLERKIDFASEREKSIPAPMEHIVIEEKDWHIFYNICRIHGIRYETVLPAPEYGIEVYISLDSFLHYHLIESDLVPEEREILERRMLMVLSEEKCS